MDQENNIDLEEYWILLKKWWWIPCILALMLSVVMAVVSYFFSTKIYEANTSLYTISKDVQLKDVTSELKLGGDLIKDYKVFIKQRAVSREVIKELKLENILTTDQLIKKLSVASEKETRIINISVKDADPKMAVILADKVAEVFSRRVMELMNVENVQVIDKAELPLIPISPSPGRNISIAFLLGIMIGVGIILVMNFLDNTLKTPEDIKEFLDFNVLATVPFINNDNSSKHIIISETEPKSIASEQFRVLRTSIQFKAIDNDLKKIVVTSSTASEGKTTTVVNLAVVMAQYGMKVLIIDADLRKATVHKYFNIDSDKGLSMCVTKKGDAKKYIQSTRISGVDVIVSGFVPPDPSEVLGSKSMKNFVDTVSKDYDIVLLDSPPIGIVTDAAVLSSFCDGVILVASAGTTKIDNAKDAKEELKKVEANILGVVLNKIANKKNDYYYHYYGSEDTIVKS